MRLEPVTVEDARRARERIAGGALRTPLVRLNADGGSGELYLKLECLQPIGSFKVRGAGNALLSARGVVADDRGARPSLAGGPVRASRVRPRRDGRQRDHRAGDHRGPARRRRRAGAVRQRRPLLRHRGGDARAAAAGARLRL